MDSNSFPSWIIALQQHRFRILWVVLSSASRWKHWLQSQYPSLNIVHALSVNASQPNWILCHGRPPGSANPCWAFDACSLLVATNTPRRSKHRNEMWDMQSLKLSHTDVGGVSDGVFRFFVFIRDGYTFDSSQINRLPIRNVSMIIDSLVSTGTPHPVPHQHGTSIPSVYRDDDGILSVAGLLPLAAPRHRFVVPSVFSATGWLLRRLVPAELLCALDFPLQLVKTTPPAVSGQIFKSCQLPIKCLQAILSLASQVCTSSAALPSPTSIEGDGGGANTFCLRSHAGDRTDTSTLVSIDSTISNVPTNSALYDTSKATKSDDAAVPELIWSERIRIGGAHLTTVQRMALNGLRTMGLRWWKRRLTRSFWSWLYKTSTNLCRSRRKEKIRWDNTSKSYSWMSCGEANYSSWCKRIFKVNQRNMVAARECISRAAASTWWEWNGGSRPFFWRWPSHYLKPIRDGVPPWFSSEPAKWIRPQNCERDTKEKVMRKLETVYNQKQYIEDGFVKNLTRFFAVPKGDHDIRMVYDASVSGLNDCLWSPWFLMPTIRSHLRTVNPGYHMADIDIGEMFLNFVMDDTLRPYCGVDFTSYFPMHSKQPSAVNWKRWSRCCMGLKSSPYNCIQGILHAAEYVMGDRHDESNPFRWKMVKLNLPGSPDYDPTLPWVAKYRSDGRIACDLLIYVDDFRPTGPTEEECWQATRATGSRCNHLGIQDASRKRRKPSTRPGAWAGSIICSENNELSVTVSQEKWNKTRDKIRWIHEQIRQEEPKIPFKELERIRGFLIYTTRTYPEMIPYLKGIHLTLDGWRGGRDPEGWKWINPEVKDEELFDYLNYGTSNSSPPEYVIPVPRLRYDIAALLELTLPKQPPKHIIRCKSALSVVYGFGDASGKGFGCGVKVDNEFFYRFGNWSSDISEKSSNYRELNNLVLGIEDWATAGLLNEREVFLFTDNTTAEGAYYRGTSSNKVLFELVLRLRKLELNHQMKLHVIHIAGTRMIESGIDGLSRGDTGEGVMGGKDVLHFIPLSQSAVERSGKLLPWVHSWFGNTIRLLSPTDWFDKGHTEEGPCLWAPPPAAAEACIEQLCIARHKRTSVAHVVIVPRLMTARWRKILGKVADTLFTVPTSLDAWPSHMHEPLIIALILPLHRFHPWTYRGSTLVGALERELRQLWETMPERAGIVLREFLSQTESLATLPEGVVRRVLCPSQPGQLSNSSGSKRRWDSIGSAGEQHTFSGRKKR